MSHASELIEQDILAYLKQHENKQLLRFITCGSVDDGKSTLIGRLLHDSKMIFEDQLAAITEDSKKVGTQGNKVDLALLVDGLQSEREQGITIDVAYRYFSTDKRKFIIADTPGHEQYTRNMATGASNCDLAIILVDARYGVQTQTRRHSFICSLLGIKQFVVAINKMDLLGFDQQRFEQIKQDYLQFAAQLNVPSIQFVPLSALNGDNVVHSSTQTPWYKDGPLLSLLEKAPVTGFNWQAEAHLPVQYVSRPNLDFRGFCGNVASGVVRVGDEVRVLPSGKTSVVKSIVTYDGDLQEAFTGQAVTLTLTTEVDVSRGDMLVLAKDAVPQSNHLKAHIVWMAEKATKANSEYLFKFASKLVSGVIESIDYRVDVNTQEHSQVEQLQLNDIAVVDLVLTQPVVADKYTNNRATGAFIVIDRLTNITVGAGMVVEQLAATEESTASYSDFEVELNALIRKHFPHWGAADLKTLLSK